MELQDFIKKLNLEKCVEHNLAPNIEIIDGKLDMGKLCCEDFNKICLKKIADFKANQVADDFVKDILDL